MKDILTPMLFWGIGILAGYFIGWISAKQYYKRYYYEKLKYGDKKQPETPKK